MRFLLKLNVQDENFRKIQYSLDNGATWNPLSGPNVNTTLALAEGNHKVIFMADDWFTKYSKDSVNFSTVDTTSPVITTVNPREGIIYPKSPLFNINVTDETALDSSYFSLDNGITKTLFEGNFIGNPNLSEGDYQALISSVDKASNKKDSIINFSIDETTPGIIATSPKSDSTYNNKNINLECLLRDKNLDLSNSYFVLNDEIQDYFNDSIVNIPLDSSKIKEGQNKVEIYASDLARNPSDTLINFIYKDTITGLKDKVIDKKYNELIAYPNPLPRGGNVRLNYPKGKTTYIDIFDMSGRKMNKTIQDNDKNGETEVNMSDYSSGVYLYRVRSVAAIYNGIVIKE